MEEHARKGKKPGDVWTGIGILAVCHVLFWAILLNIRRGDLLIGLGITQLIYLLPLTFFFIYRKRPGIVQGLWIAGGLTMLLNAACYGIVFLIVIGL
jgi:hypothetical protein